LTEELSEYTYTVYSKDEYKLILSDKWCIKQNDCLSEVEGNRHN
jgi:hypothetical protein